MAKYEACILGIRMAVDMNIKKLLVIRDFDMLIYQVQGEWTTKNVKIRLYLLCVKELCKKLIKNEFKHIPRNQNEFVDALATLSCMIHHPDKNNIDLIEIEVQGQHVYYFHIDEEPDGKLWYYDIKRFLKIREYPEKATNGSERALKRLGNQFFLNG
uniref:RNase H type-1 domain-containing protein n=2 Tax=Nicotiana TaxID=4085 RepID=A0A1S4DH18_TOBAC